MTGQRHVQVQTWDPRELGRRAEQVLDVYAEAMDVPRPVAGNRHSILEAHAGRAGLRAIAALTDRDELIGIAYGHLGENGQWWHDQVLTAIDKHGGESARAQWAGAFEVCELHVLPAWQGAGLGRALLAALLDPAPAPVALLTTPEGHIRAREFYRTGGWVDLVRALRFPGDPRSFVVLGRTLE